MSVPRKGRIYRNKIIALNINIIWSLCAEAICGGRPFPIFKPELSKLAERGYFAKKPNTDTLTAATLAKVTRPACASLHNMCAPDNDNDKQKKSKMMFYFLAHIKVYTWSEFVVYEK